jgi:hypothetical protein
MDHLGSSSSGGNPYSQGEPFFDLLQPNTSSGYHHASQNSPPVYFANDDVLPSMDFQPIVDSVGKGKADDNMRGWQSQSANSVRFLPSRLLRSIRRVPVLFESFVIVSTTSCLLISTFEVLCDPGLSCERNCYQFAILCLVCVILTL